MVSKQGEGENKNQIEINCNQDVIVSLGDAKGEASRHLTGHL
jgi:hypothetical protein